VYTTSTVGGAAAGLFLLPLNLWCACIMLSIDFLMPPVLHLHKTRFSLHHFYQRSGQLFSLPGMMVFAHIRYDCFYHVILTPRYRLRFTITKVSKHSTRSAATLRLHIGYIFPSSVQ
jgi:hypothetical protein